MTDNETKYLAGEGDGISTVFQGKDPHHSIRPGSVCVLIGEEGTLGVLVDDGEGGLMGEGCSGLLEYEEKKVSLEFEEPPEKGVPILIEYSVVEE